MPVKSTKSEKKVSVRKVFICFFLDCFKILMRKISI